jgi:hypothetical protein
MRKSNGWRLLEDQFENKCIRGVGPRDEVRREHFLVKTLTRGNFLLSICVSPIYFQRGQGPSGDSGLSHKGRHPSVNVLLRGMTGSTEDINLEGDIGVLADVAETVVSGVEET